MHDEEAEEEYGGTMVSYEVMLITETYISLENQ